MEESQTNIFLKYSEDNTQKVWLKAYLYKVNTRSSRKNFCSYYESFLNVRNSSAEWKEWVFKYLFNAFLFIRILRFDGWLLKIFMSAQYALFENMKGWQLVCEDVPYS
jgi:hypothetical protein